MMYKITVKVTFFFLCDCFAFYMKTWTDAKVESRPSESELIYVPRDEELNDIKQEAIDKGKFMAVLQNIVPALTDKIMGSQALFNIDYFIKESGQSILFNLGGAAQDFFKFDPPKVFSSEST